MSAEARKVASATIADLIDAQVLTGLVPGSVVALYAAKGTEVDTTAIAAHALDRGLVVAYPRVAKPSPVLAYHRVDAGALVPGVFGLLEPRADAPPVSLADLSAIIVPGIAFDATGHRLGWGRGYYDNTLAAARSVTSIGVAFACQLLPAVPTTPADVPVHFVITEAGVVRAP